MASGVRGVGEFCWVNVMSPKPDEAREFFAGLLGWTYFDMDGMGYGIEAGGRKVGGLFDVHGPNSPAGLPPHVGVMVKVASADATAEKVAALGGKAMAPFDVMENGRMAVCFDPNGAPFDVWEPKSKPGTDVDTATTGAPSWFETLTTDVGRATEFYAELFGWSANVQTVTGFEYTVFQLDGRDVAGMMKVPHEEIPPHWGVYFTVPDADAAIAKATTLGGTVFIPVMPIPKIGRFCGLISPQGVRFYAIEYQR